MSVPSKRTVSGRGVSTTIAKTPSTNSHYGLQQMPNGKLDIVGYTDEKEVIREKTLGAQRSVNVKYYLTTDGPNKVDASSHPASPGRYRGGQGDPLLLRGRGQAVQRASWNRVPWWKKR